MEETKIQLTEKLETLEQQVSETVQTTGTAVSATVGAVQETVESVTEAVQEAVHTVGHAFDLRRQIDEHPWWVLGGAFAIGCLAEEFLAGPPKKSVVFPRSDGTPDLSAERADFVSRPAHDPAQHHAAVSAAYQRGQNSAWNQLQTKMFEMVGELLQKVAERTLPELVNKISENLVSMGTAAFEKKDEAESEDKPEPAEEDRGRQVYMPSTERFRSGNPF